MPVEHYSRDFPVQRLCSFLPSLFNFFLIELYNWHDSVLFLLLYSFGALIDAHAKRVPASTAVCAIDFNGHLVCSSFVPKSKVAIALLRNVDFLLMRVKT